MSRGFLTADQERELLTQYRSTGSPAACDCVVLAHMPLVRKMVSRVRISGIEHDDLIQDGVIGLMEAIKRFDPDRGIRFSTYATWWIKAAITEAAVRSPTVRGSTASAGKRAFWKIGHGLISSLDAPAGDNGDLTFADLLIDETIVPADEIADIKRSGQKLANAVNRLPARQREIICSRYERDETLQVVADRAGVSKERIRQIQSAALASLKAELEPT